MAAGPDGEEGEDEAEESLLGQAADGRGNLVYDVWSGRLCNTMDYPSPVWQLNIVQLDRSIEQLAEVTRQVVKSPPLRYDSVAAEKIATFASRITGLCELGAFSFTRGDDARRAMTLFLCRIACRAEQFNA